MKLARRQPEVGGNEARIVAFDVNTKQNCCLPSDLPASRQVCSRIHCAQGSVDALGDGAQRLVIVTACECLVCKRIPSQLASVAEMA